MSNDMTRGEQLVWDAIEQALHDSEDVDIQAGLAWITDADKKRVVDAAVKAIAEAAIVEAGRDANG